MKKTTGLLGNLGQTVLDDNLQGQYVSEDNLYFYFALRSRFYKIGVFANETCLISLKKKRNNLRYCQNICDALDILEQCMYKIMSYIFTEMCRFSKILIIIVHLLHNCLLYHYRVCLFLFFLTIIRLFLHSSLYY